MFFGIAEALKSRPRCCECGDEASIHSHDDGEFYCTHHYEKHLIDKANEDSDIGVLACPACDDDIIIDWKNREVYSTDDFVEHLMEEADRKAEFSWIDEDD